MDGSSRVRKYFNNKYHVFTKIIYLQSQTKNNNYYG